MLKNMTCRKSIVLSIGLVFFLGIGKMTWALAPVCGTAATPFNVALEFDGSNYPSAFQTAWPIQPRTMTLSYLGGLNLHDPIGGGLIRACTAKPDNPANCTGAKDNQDWAAYGISFPDLWVKDQAGNCVCRGTLKVSVDRSNPNFPAAYFGFAVDTYLYLDPSINDANLQDLLNYFPNPAFNSSYEKFLRYIGGVYAGGYAATFQGGTKSTTCYQSFLNPGKDECLVNVDLNVTNFGRAGNATVEYSVFAAGPVFGNGANQGKNCIASSNVYKFFIKN